VKSVFIFFSLAHLWGKMNSIRKAQPLPERGAGKDYSAKVGQAQRSVTPKQARLTPAQAPKQEHKSVHQAIHVQ
jgi:hypothetical protein